MSAARETAKNPAIRPLQRKAQRWLGSLHSPAPQTPVDMEFFRNRRAHKVSSYFNRRLIKPDRLRTITEESSSIEGETIVSEA